MLLAQFQRLFLVLGGGAGGALKSGFRGGVMSGRAGSETVNFERSKQQSLQLHGIIIIGSIEYHKSLKAVKIPKNKLTGLAEGSFSKSSVHTTGRFDKRFVL